MAQLTNALANPLEQGRTSQTQPAKNRRLLQEEGIGQFDELEPSEPTPQILGEARNLIEIIGQEKISYTVEKPATGSDSENIPTNQPNPVREEEQGKIISLIGYLRQMPDTQITEEHLLQAVAKGEEERKFPEPIDFVAFKTEKLATSNQTESQKMAESKVPNQSSDVLRDSGISFVNEITPTQTDPEPVIKSKKVSSDFKPAKTFLGFLGKVGELTIKGISETVKSIKEVRSALTELATKYILPQKAEKPKDEKQQKKLEEAQFTKDNQERQRADKERVQGQKKGFIAKVFMRLLNKPSLTEEDQHMLGEVSIDKDNLEDEYHAHALAKAISTKQEEQKQQQELPSANKGNILDFEATHRNDQNTENQWQNTAG